MDDYPDHHNHAANYAVVPPTSPRRLDHGPRWSAAAPPDQRGHQGRAIAITSFVSAYKIGTGHSNTDFCALNIHPYQVIAQYPHTQVSLLNTSTKPPRTVSINNKIYDRRLTTTLAYTNVTYSVSPKLITMTNVMNNGKNIYHTRMVVKVLINNTVVVHAINTENPASNNVPFFPTGTRYHDCPEAVKRKEGREWVPGKFVDGVPLNGTPIRLKFYPQSTGNGTEWARWLKLDRWGSVAGVVLAGLLRSSLRWY